eukprot:4172721-Pleurochrysis_carterae.AAC.2
MNIDDSWYGMPKERKQRFLSTEENECPKREEMHAKRRTRRIRASSPEAGTRRLTAAQSETSVHDLQ